ncbi:MAG TPA: fumarylacetoacetate hydrolase family protein [Aliidongia sp.]|uniref:fumarylacetoacetate hydrolase family protein n=1 Tax=Aliidongia sp. TaxID=1914230 RepID=UPI002DDCAC84|nr:fumarylacetoacetate hydrolase family protein [Aliidongia sp.]HEV2677130.1 fumarylacetoacetate hydrolase family protein [Aliidongia sp.]
MTLWVRYALEGEIGFGTIEGDQIAEYRGDPFQAPQPTGRTTALADATLLTPTLPSKFIGLWNNYHAAAAKAGNAIPEEPLYFLKGANSFHPTGVPIRTPRHYDGKIVFEGELGIVIGRRLFDVDEAAATAGIFGYTCVNDVTAFDVLNRDPSFAQWARAKSFDTFGVFGPAIATGLDPATLTIRTLVNGRERQNYPASDMILPPARIVSLISREMTLEPGDVIACGTSLGAGVMRAGAEVEVVIDGIGTLGNTLA